MIRLNKTCSHLFCDKQADFDVEGRERRGQLKAKGGAEKGEGDQWVKQWSVWVHEQGEAERGSIDITQHCYNSILLNISLLMHQDQITSSKLFMLNKTTLPHTLTTAVELYTEDVRRGET